MLISGVDGNMFRQENGTPADEILIDSAGHPGERMATLHWLGKENRKYSRYIRDDIAISILQKDFLFRNNGRSVRLLDVSQHGAAISLERKLKTGKLINVCFSFSDGGEFPVRARVVNSRLQDGATVYGLKFEPADSAFEEHLLKSGLRIKLMKNLCG